MFNFSAFSFPAALTRFGLVVLLLTWCRPAAAQAPAPAWQTAQAVPTAVAGPRVSSAVSATAVDAAGNVYIAGSFSGTVVLGSTTLTSLGSEDVFLAKFNPRSNQFVWAQRAGGTSVDVATGLAVNGTSVYMTGNFVSPTAEFGGTSLTNAGNYDAFVTKLTDAGSTSSFVWAKRVGGTDDDYASALAVSGTSVYVAGSFRSATADFGGISLANTGFSDIFVTKLTDAGSTGSFVWAQWAGSTGNEEATALAITGTNIYIGGDFAGPASTFGSTNLTSTGYTDGFVAKLVDGGSSSSFVWAQRVGGAGYDGVSEIAAMGTSIYVTGVFGSPTASFGSTSLTSAGSLDVFLAKLIDTGPGTTFAWVQQAGGADVERVSSLVVSGASIYITGGFTSPTASFGGTVLTGTSNGRYFPPNVFVAKLTDAGGNGSFTWAQQAGGMDTEYANALALSGTSLYVAGSFNGPTTAFGAITIFNSSLSINPAQGFLASLTDLTLSSTAAAPPREPAALFPNPARAAATLRRPAGAGAAALALTDALGRTVRRYPAPAGPTDTALDLGGLPAGLYLLRGAGPALRLTVE